MADGDVIKLSGGHQTVGPLISTDIVAALEAANSPGAANPFATAADVPAAADTIGLTRLRKVVFSYDQFSLDPALGVYALPLYQLQEGDWLYLAQLLVTTAFNDTAGDPVPITCQIQSDTGNWALNVAGNLLPAPDWGGGGLVNADQGTQTELYSVLDPKLPMTPTPAGDPVQTWIRLDSFNDDGSAGVAQALFWVNEFTARGLGIRLLFGQQPSAVVAGVAMSPAVTVRVMKADNSVDTSDQTTQITVSLSDETVGGGVLGGTLTRTVVNGVATFNNLTVDVAEDANLLATADTAAGKVKSAAFTVSAP